MRAHVSSSDKPVQSGRRVANVGGEEPLPLPKLLPLPVCGVVCARRTRPSAPSRSWRSRQLPNPSSAGSRLITQPAWDRHFAALYSEQLDPVRLAWPWTVATSIAPSVAESSRPISYMCPEIACAIESRSLQCKWKNRRAKSAPPGLRQHTWPRIGLRHTRPTAPKQPLRRCPRHYTVARPSPRPQSFNHLPSAPASSFKAGAVDKSAGDTGRGCLE